MRILLIISALIFMSQNMYAQSISDFQWENRLILAFTDSVESQIFQKQLKIFKDKREAFEDRKLLFIQVVPNKHRIIFPQTSAWQSSKVFENNKKEEGAFEIILIGLDGGVKLRQTEILETKKLFDLIDSMPMRQAEMHRNN